MKKKYQSPPHASAFVFLAQIAALTTCAAGPTFTDLNIDFSGYAFTSGSISGSSSFNIINDTTGAKLASDNGDLDDITLTITNNVPGSADGAYANAEITGSGLRSNHGYSKFFSNTYTGSVANNPGTLISQTFRVTFANHLNITDFSTDFTSLNTRGITWEHSEFSFLKTNGTYFSAQPTYQDHLTTSTNSSPQPVWHIGSEGAGNGPSGSPSTGWFVASSTGTVTLVGDDLTVAGTNGSRENLTSTNGNSILDYNDVGLTAGTAIGGFEWTVYVEDNRGQNNGATNWTTTQTFFEITSTVPEPSALALLGTALLFGSLKRRRG